MSNEPTIEVKAEPAPRPSWLAHFNLGAGAPGDSDILGVSVRCWLAILLVTTLCYLAVLGAIDGAAFTAVAGMVIAFYFNRPATPKPPTPPAP